MIAYPSRWIEGYGRNSGWWSDDTHPRMLADVNGDQQDDIVGFGNGAVCVSFSTGRGFTPECATVLVGEYGYQDSAGGWTSNTVYPRMMAKVNNDGHADIVGFGSLGVHLSRWVPPTDTSPGGFESCPNPILSEYGTIARIAEGRWVGGWEDNIKHPRMMADVNDDGRADIVGFGNGGVVVALANAFGSGFEQPSLALAEFGVNQGWQDNIKHPRMMADVNGDTHADIVGFGPGGVFVALGNDAGSFDYPSIQPVIAEYGTNQGWVDNIRYPRMLADVDGHNGPDIVAFGNGGVSVSLATGDGAFLPCPEQASIFQFGWLSEAGGWTDTGDEYSYTVTSPSVQIRTGYRPKYPRMMADIDGDGLDDIVGFANAGVLVATSTGTGFDPATGNGFNSPLGLPPNNLFTTEYGYATSRDFQECTTPDLAFSSNVPDGGYPACRSASLGIGWRSTTNPRMTAVVKDENVTDSKRKAAVVGFADDGVLVAQELDMQSICAKAAEAQLGVYPEGGYSKEQPCPDNISCFAQRMYDFGPRNACVQTCGPNGELGSFNESTVLIDVKNWIQQKYAEFGFTSVDEGSESTADKTVCSEPVKLCNTWDRFNVVATKKGNAEHATEFVEVSAHMDSHSHSPGAVDNASGTAGLLEIARVLKDYPTRHSFRFIHYVGHESQSANDQGCRQSGSVYHISKVLNDPQQKVIAALNMDGIGYVDPEDPTFKNTLVFAPMSRSDFYASSPKCPVGMLSCSADEQSDPLAVDLDGDGDHDGNDVVNYALRYGGPPSNRIADFFKVAASVCNIDIGWAKVTWPAGDAVVYSGYDFPWILVENVLNKGAIPSVASVKAIPFRDVETHQCGDTMQNLDLENVLRTTRQNLAVLLALDSLDASP